MFIRVSSSSISVENINRFRGLEKPIVIILPTNSMSDIEYFCSYSRATSKCIVILEAFSLKNNNYGTLGKEIAKFESERIEELLQIELTSKLLKENQSHLNLEEINSSLSLYWSQKWKAYLLLGLDDALKNMLMVYFKLSESGNIFSYENQSRAKLTYISSSKMELLDYNTPNCSTLKHCLNCNTLVPERFWKELNATFCFSCYKAHNERDYFFEDNVSKIVHSFNSPTRENLNGITLVLNLFCQLKLIDRDVLSRIISKSNRLIGCLINIHILLKLEKFISTNNLSIETKQLQKQIKEDNELFKAIEFMKWNGYFQDCLSKLENEDILVKAQKGFRNLNPHLFQHT